VDQEVKKNERAYISNKSTNRSNFHQGNKKERENDILKMKAQGRGKSKKGLPTKKGSKERE